MKLFVTGGAGFIGSNYVRATCWPTATTVVVFDALTYAGNLETSRDGSTTAVHVRHGDICDRDAVRAPWTGCDAVVHFAAESHVDRSLLDPTCSCAPTATAPT
jgi:dTDP-glucose 4,6-dehydratase